MSVHVSRMRRAGRRLGAGDLEIGRWGWSRDGVTECGGTGNLDPFSIRNLQTVGIFAG
jgi:hypothetical protein